MKAMVGGIEKIKIGLTALKSDANRAKLPIFLETWRHKCYVRILT